jgi:hypothetical protein
VGGVRGHRGGSRAVADEVGDLLRPAAFLALAGTLSCVGCGDDFASRQARAEERRLKRQLASLREMIAAERRGSLISPDWLAIGLEESAFRAVIQASLPQEAMLTKRLHVRIEKAEVSFESGSSLVSLGARVTDAEQTDRFADVVFTGGLGELQITPDGKLSARVVIDGVEVPQAQAGSADPSLVRATANQLARRSRERLEDLVPPVEVPVRVDQDIPIPGFDEGPVRVAAGTLPLHVELARVLPISGRLWIMLAVKAGPWQAAK